MSMEYNRSPISMREGHIYIDGVECCDSVKCEIKYTPEVWTGRQLGDRVASSRWIGGAYSGTITRRRSTPWLKEAIADYIDSGETPEFKIQGIMDDPNSDYYKDNGSIVVTAVGCVLTGDLNLINLDSGGDIVDDVISFNAYSIV